MAIFFGRSMQVKYLFRVAGNYTCKSVTSRENHNVDPISLLYHLKPRRRILKATRFRQRERAVRAACRLQRRGQESLGKGRMKSEVQNSILSRQKASSGRFTPQDLRPSGCGGNGGRAGVVVGGHLRKVGECSCLPVIGSLRVTGSFDSCGHERLWCRLSRQEGDVSLSIDEPTETSSSHRSSSPHVIQNRGTFECSFAHRGSPELYLVGGDSVQDQGGRDGGSTAKARRWAPKRTEQSGWNWTRRRLRTANRRDDVACRNDIRSRGPR